MHRLLLATWLLGAGLLAGCRSTSHRFVFLPSPLEVIVQPDGDGPVLARALVSIERGVRRKSELPEMEVRLRIENESSEQLELLTERLLLVASDLTAFGRPRVAGERLIPPGEAVTYDLAFPYPAGLDFSAPGVIGLNLRFSIRHAGGEVTSTATFERIVPIDPAGRTHWHVGIGTTL